MGLVHCSFKSGYGILRIVPCHTALGISSADVVNTTKAQLFTRIWNSRVRSLDCLDHTESGVNIYAMLQKMDAQFDIAWLGALIVHFALSGIA